jgi:hypothetical protein
MRYFGSVAVCGLAIPTSASGFNFRNAAQNAPATQQTYANYWAAAAPTAHAGAKDLAKVAFATLMCAQFFVANGTKDRS